MIVADDSLEVAIESCCSMATASIDSIENLIEANEEANDAADESLAAAITAENSGRVSADTSLASAIDAEKDRIDAILEGSDVDLDQFAEIVSFVNGIDLENDNALLSAVTSIGTAISGEEDARESADGSLASAINKEATDRATADTSLATALGSTELFLNGKINTETENRVSANGSLEIVIATNRTDANTAISDEESARVAADELLQENLDSAVSDLRDEDTALAGLIEAERDRALEAEESLEEALAAEVANLLANTDLTAIDSFQEVVNELEDITNDFENTYFKKVVVSGLVNGTNKDFTLAAAVRTNSEAIYYNGLLQEAGVDYTLSGTAVQFTYFPAAGGKVTAYGVYNA
jgi:hypothetical protein